MRRRKTHKEDWIKVNIILGTTLIDVYMKLGCVDNALEIFYGIVENEISSRYSLIIGFVMNGLVDKSLDVFSKMKKSGTVPN